MTTVSKSQKYPDSRNTAASFRFPTSLFMVMALLTSGLLSAWGAEIEWLPLSGSNDYNTGSNWAGGVVPGASDIAIFGNPASGDQIVNLSVSSNPQPGTIQIGSINGTLTLNSIGNSPGTVLLQPSNTSVFGTGSGANIVIQKTGSSNFTVRGVGAVVVGGEGASNNTLTVQGSGVMFGSQFGTIHVGYQGSNGNLIHVKDGATLSTRSGTIGRADSSNNTVKLSGSGTTWSIPNSDALDVTLGITTGRNNELIVENGAAFNSGVVLRAYGGSVIIDNGTIDLTTAATDRNFLMRAAGSLQGQGTFRAANLISEASGAFVSVGTEGSFGVLNTEFTGDGWHNDNVQIRMGIGDVSMTPVAGTDYDFLNIDGNFIFGGELVIDLSDAVISSTLDLKLIGWSEAVGSSEDLDVTFINGQSLGYYVTETGLYIIPEPSQMGLGMIVFWGVYFIRRLQLSRNK